MINGAQLLFRLSGVEELVVLEHLSDWGLRISALSSR